MNRPQDENYEYPIAWRQDSHCLALDGIRGLAILSVTLYRLCRELDPSAHPVLAVVHRFAPIGERGVDLFFVLSGFLITGILLRTKSEPNYFRNFIARRSLRIFPLYFLSLLLGLLILPNVFRTEVFELARQEQFFLWTYTSNLRMAWLNEWCFGAFDHFWSLAVEEHFYFVWPAVILLLTRRSLAYACFFIIISAGIARTFAALDGRFDVAVSVATFFRADALSLGALLAIVLTSSISAQLIRRVAGIAVLVTFPALVAVAISGKHFLEIPSTLCPVLCAACMALVLLGRQQSLNVRCAESLPLRILGKYSYGMYVFQLPLVALVPMPLVLRFLPSNPLLAALLYVAGLFAVLLALAIASFHLFESHFLRLKKMFP